MTDLGWSLLAFAFSAVPALLFFRNLRLYRRPVKAKAHATGVSVLIPARNEEKTIGAAVAAALSNDELPLEVVVLDDGSTDATPIVIQAIASLDGRVRLVEGKPLPAGWCGKQHACATLAEQARYPVLCFIDADVRLESGAVASMVSFLERTGSDLVSGVPRQQTGTLLEKLLIPLIHFILLAFLPMAKMRRSVDPAYAAGCGQLFIAKADSYKRAGGHAAIRSTLHDGINLPRAFRRAGLKTDIFDATSLATCRMYQTNREVWLGLRKNAWEGLGSPALILPATVVLTLGQIAPLLLVFTTAGFTQAVAAAGLACAYFVRIRSMKRFAQPMLGVCLHPLGIVLLLTIQWQSFARHLIGSREQWKGRSYIPADR